jgi:hypothetical protein
LTSSLAGFFIAIYRDIKNLNIKEGPDEYIFCQINLWAVEKQLLFLLMIGGWGMVNYK